MYNPITGLQSETVESRAATAQQQLASQNMFMSLVQLLSPFMSTGGATATSTMNDYMKDLLKKIGGGGPSGTPGPVGDGLTPGQGGGNPGGSFIPPGAPSTPQNPLLSSLSSILQSSPAQTTPTTQAPTTITGYGPDGETVIEYVPGSTKLFNGQLYRNIPNTNNWVRV